LRVVLEETFLKGEAACRPLIARDGLGPSFVDPALKRLEAQGVRVAFNRRLRSLAIDGDRIRGLDFGDAAIDVADGDVVILALPAFRVAQLLPRFEPPGDGETIVNAHFRLAAPAAAPMGAPLVGLIGGIAHWIFLRGDIVSLTVSAADDVAEDDTDDLTAALWRETVTALDLGDAEYEAARIIKERRATFDQSPEGVRRRKPTETPIGNLLLAGDWTDTGLPATIESAVRSGHRAARIAIERLRSN